VEKIALIRPGAIGDIIMTFNFLSQLKQKYEVHYFCHSSIYSLLKNFVNSNNLLDHFYSLESYNSNNFIETINLVGYPLGEGYPYKKMQNHLLYYFANEMKSEFNFDSFELNLPPLPKKIKNQNTPRYITIQNKTGWSVYKEWWGWQELINLLKLNHPEIEIYQIGGPSDPQIKDIDGSFCGDSFEDNLAAQAWSNMHVGLDSVFNHTTNINWTNKGKVKSIILFGSTQADASGYPHNNNVSLGLSCQPCFREDPKISNMSLGPCINPPNQSYEEPKHACMRQITPEMIYQKIYEGNFKI
jgi:ADP-heptose:LPS heptosyltransferase